MGHLVIDKLPNISSLNLLTWLFTDEDSQCIFEVREDEVVVSFYQLKIKIDEKHIPQPLTTGLLEMAKREFNSFISKHNTRLLNEGNGG